MRLKPSYPVLRRDHPLADGLVGAWLNAEGNGSVVRDFTGSGSDLVAAAEHPWLPGRAGYESATNFAGTGPSWATPALPPSQKNQNATLFWQGQFLGVISGGGNPRLFSIEANSTSTAPYVSLGFYRASSTSMRIAWNNGTLRTITRETPSSTDEIGFAITHRSGQVVAYHDGKQVATSATAGTITYSDTARLQVKASGNDHSPNTTTGCGLLFNRVLSAAEILELHDDPFVMFRPRQRSYFAMAGEAPAGTTVTPGTATLTLTAFAPTVSATANQTFVPGTATLSLTPFAPTVTADNAVEVTPTTASLALTPFAPTVQATDNKTVEPTTASLALTGFAPTVQTTANVEVEPTTASLSLTPFAPTVSASEAGVFEPTTATLSLTGFAPTVEATANQAFEPTTATLTLTGFAPTIQVGDAVTVEPATATLTLTPFAPTVATTNNITILPQLAELAITTFAPTIEGSVLVTPATATLVITTHRPNLGDSVSVASFYYYYYLMG